MLYEIYASIIIKYDYEIFTKSGFKIVQILIEIVELEEHSKVKLMR